MVLAVSVDGLGFVFDGAAAQPPWRWHLSDGQGRGTVQPQHLHNRSHGKGGGCLIRC